MERLLSLIFVGNIASAVVGLLQTYYPERFMPPEFHNAAFAKIVTYTLATGQKLTRPPGLSDTAGGAAVAGAAVAIMGIIFGSRPGQGLVKRAVCFGLAAIGFFDLFLTQIRSLFLMVLMAMGAVCFLLVRQRRPGQSTVIGTLTVGLVAGSLVWAIAVGGKPVSDRFLQLLEHDPFSAYQQNRGQFLEATFTELMFQYPLGAGLGRWGPMTSYFGGRADADLTPIHAELQLTGWLLDGGILMWFLYGGALLCSMYGVYRLADPTGSPRLTQSANMVFALNLLVLGQAMAGPSFNTAMGTQFWLLAAALHGTAERGGVRPLSGGRKPPESVLRGLTPPARRKAAVAS
jgi:hypothetical protein